MKDLKTSWPALVFGIIIIAIAITLFVTIPAKTRKFKGGQRVKLHQHEFCQCQIFEVHKFQGDVTLKCNDGKFYRIEQPELLEVCD